MIDKRLVFDKVAFTTAEDVIRYMGGQMQALKRVKDSYVDAVIEREKIFPTGLNLGALGIAIPHTEACHVNETTICVARLQEEIPFQQMVDPKTSIAVRFVFLLAVQDPEGQLDVLRKLMGVFQDQAMLQDFMQAEDTTVIVEKLNKIFREEENNE